MRFTSLTPTRMVGSSAAASPGGADGPLGGVAAKLAVAGWAGAGVGDGAPDCCACSVATENPAARTKPNNLWFISSLFYQLADPVPDLGKLLTVATFLGCAIGLQACQKLLKFLGESRFQLDDFAG